MSDPELWWIIPETNSKDKNGEDDRYRVPLKFCRNCVVPSELLASKPGKIYCVWIGKDIDPFSEPSDHKCDNHHTESYFRKKR